jgi:hypothetical protein
VDTEADTLCSIMASQMRAGGFDPNRLADPVYLPGFDTYVRPLSVAERVKLFRWREANPTAPWLAAPLVCMCLCHEDGRRLDVDPDVLADCVAPAVVRGLAAECIRVCGLDVPVPTDGGIPTDS